MPNTKSIIINKKKIYYKHFLPGKKPIKWIFLVLHGWWGSSDSRIEVATILQNKWYEIIIPDLPWFGETEILMEYDLEKYAKLILLLIKHLKLKNINLLWHSNWGRIAITLWDSISRDNQIISHLILNNSAWIVHSLTIKKKIYGAIAKVWKIFKFLPGFKLLRKYFYKAIGWHDYLKAKSPLIKKTFLNVFRASIEDKLEHISTDTTIIRWENDTYTPLSDWQKMHQLIPWSKLYLCKWEKHWIHLRNPKLLVQNILKSIN